MQSSLPPFHCSYTPAMAELIAQLNCSLILSTYQAGKVIFLSSDGERIIQLPRTFNTPMGVAIKNNLLAIACKEQVIISANSPDLAWNYPVKPNCYDSMFVPRAIYFTGLLSMHDLAWVEDSLVGVNTQFSCLCLIDHTFNFKPIWKPSFITSLQHEDRCHLNGMAVDGKKIRYVTALGETDTPEGWRTHKTTGGVLIDLENNASVLRNLPMPHSPRIINDELYLLLSATGEVVKAETEAGNYEVVNRLNGFVRGMSHYGDYLFVATSKLRKTHIFGDLESAQRKDLICGITAIYLPTGAIVGQLVYENSCDEIYDVMVLPEKRRPNILRVDQDIHRYALVIPETTYWTVPPKGL